MEQISLSGITNIIVRVYAIQLALLLEQITLSPMITQTPKAFIGFGQAALLIGLLPETRLWPVMR
jgi:hypothetical protein